MENWYIQIYLKDYCGEWWFMDNLRDHVEIFKKDDETMQKNYNWCNHTQTIHSSYKCKAFLIKYWERSVHNLVTISFVLSFNFWSSVYNSGNDATHLEQCDFTLDAMIDLSSFLIVTLAVSLTPSILKLLNNTVCGQRNL